MDEQERNDLIQQIGLAVVDGTSLDIDLPGLDIQTSTYRSGAMHYDRASSRQRNASSLIFGGQTHVCSLEVGLNGQLLDQPSI